jgi:hypothetical protein
MRSIKEKFQYDTPRRVENHSYALIQALTEKHFRSKLARIHPY